MMELQDILEKYAKRPEGWLGIGVSPEVKARLRLLHRRISRDDLAEEGLDKDPHVTVAYGLDEKLPEDMIRKLLTMPKGSKIKIGSMSTFDNPDSTVLKMDVDSEDLHRIHRQIEDEIGIPGKTFKDFKPHITIAKLKKDADPSKYLPLANILAGKEFDADDIRLRLGETKYSPKSMDKAASVGTEQLGSMVPFMDFPYAAGMVAPEITEKKLKKRHDSNISDVLLPIVGAYKYGQRSRKGVEKVKTGPFAKENYMSEILGPYTSTALVGLATMLASIASGKSKGIGKAFGKGATIGAGLNLLGWGAAKTDPMVDKKRMEEVDADMRWANWLVPGASKYHGTQRMEYMYDKPETHEHLMKDGKLKPGVYIANRSVFRGVPLLGSYLKDARHSYIVAVPNNPDKFSKYTTDIGNGNRVIIMGGYNEELPSEMGKRQLAGIYNKGRDVDTLKSGLGIIKDTRRNYTRIKPITKGWSPSKIDKKIKALTTQMDTFQANTKYNPVIYAAYPSKSAKKVIKKRLSNCNSFAQTLLDRAGFDNRKTKINDRKNPLAPGDTTRIDFAFEKPPVTAMPMRLKPNEKQEYVKEMKKAAFLTGYMEHKGMNKLSSAITPYGRTIANSVRAHNQGLPTYSEYPDNDKEPEAPVMNDSSSWVTPVLNPIFGDGVAGTAADIGTYFIPGVGLVRTGYDTLADAANVFGKDLTLKQRLGYGLSSGFNALFTGMEAMTLGSGLGSGTGKLILAPLTRLAKSMKKGKQFARAVKKYSKFTKAIEKGTHPWTKGIKGAPIRFMYSKNPYIKTVKTIDKKTGAPIVKEIFWRSPKAVLHGAAKTSVPIGGMIYSAGLTADKTPEPDSTYDEFRPENYNESNE